MRLQYQIACLGTSLVFRILEMDEQFRYSEKDKWNKHMYTCKDGMVITSMRLICILIHPDAPRVYLRGEHRESDMYSSSVEFSTETECYNFRNRMEQNLLEWANEWKGWPDLGVRYEHMILSQVFVDTVCIFGGG